MKSKKIIFFTYLFLFIGCSSLQKNRSISSNENSEEKIHISNVEFRSTESPDLHTTLGINDHNAEFRSYVYEDVKDKNVLWYGAAGSEADWCRNEQGEVIYSIEGLKINVKICERVDTLYENIKDYISKYRKEVKELKKIQSRVTEVFPLMPHYIGKTVCKIDTTPFDEADYSFSCEITLSNNKRSKDLLLGIGRFKSERLFVLTLGISYLMRGSRATSTSEVLGDSIIVIDEDEHSFRRSYNFEHFNYKPSESK